MSDSLELSHRLLDSARTYVRRRHGLDEKAADLGALAVVVDHLACRRPDVAHELLAWCEERAAAVTSSESRRTSQLVGLALYVLHEMSLTGAWGDLLAELPPRVVRRLEALTDGLEAWPHTPAETPEGSEDGGS